MSRYEIRNAALDKIRERKKHGVPGWVNRATGWRRTIRQVVTLPWVIAVCCVIAVMWTARLPLLAFAWIGHYSARIVRRYYGWDYLP